MVHVILAALVSCAALSKADALAARERLWNAHADAIRTQRAQEIADRSIEVGGVRMRFWYEVFGDRPEAGRSLWISMHGGGGAPTEVNDKQWENQKRLYRPAEGVYLAPRAPTDTWNLWHQGHIDDLFGRLIEDLVVLEGVDPDRVYILGYSAGGDGVYQLAPRMADRLAAAAMMAGHPNETRPDGLRNLPFALHVGADDGGYDRNAVAARWKRELEELASKDPGGYVHVAKLHAGKGHWMDREDAEALPWMGRFTRDLRPTKVVWLQDDVTHRRFYWLAVDDPKQGERIVVEREGQTIRVLEAPPGKRLHIRLDDSMLDLDREVVVIQGSEELFRGVAERRESVLSATLAERGDPKGMFVAEIIVETERPSAAPSAAPSPNGGAHHD